MTPKTVGSFIEQVGVPVATAIACGFLVWWLLKWLTGSLGSQISDIRKEIKEETADVEKQIRELHHITISLVDRIRVLERNTLLAYTTILSQLGCKEMPNWHLTRKERLAELRQQSLDVGRNGEVNDEH